MFSRLRAELEKIPASDMVFIIPHKGSIRDLKYEGAGVTRSRALDFIAGYLSEAGFVDQELIETAITEVRMKNNSLEWKAACDELQETISSLKEGE